MGYSLGSKSLLNLQGVHPDLVEVVKLAITLTTQDFMVFEGLRTQARQDEYLRRGVTKVKFSQHMVQHDGFGHATDLVPWVDGGPRWEWGLIYPIAAAMHEAARLSKVNLTWGGVWDRRLNDLPAGVEAMKHEVLAYEVRHPGPDFIDGPHYQLA